MSCWAWWSWHSATWPRSARVCRRCPTSWWAESAAVSRQGLWLRVNLVCEGCDRAASRPLGLRLAYHQSGCACDPNIPPGHLALASFLPAADSNTHTAFEKAQIASCVDTARAGGSSEAAEARRRCKQLCGPTLKGLVLKAQIAAEADQVSSHICHVPAACRAGLGLTAGQGADAPMLIAPLVHEVPCPQLGLRPPAPSPSKLLQLMVFNGITRTSQDEEVFDLLVAGEQGCTLRHAI